VKIKATRKLANTPTGFIELTKWIKKHAEPAIPIVYTMEATGVYYEQIAWYLFTHKQAVSVILPNKARQYAKSLGFKSKNDKIDAIGLARMGLSRTCLYGTQ
jgi:transposase